MSRDDVLTKLTELLGLDGAILQMNWYELIENLRHLGILQIGQQLCRTFLFVCYDYDENTLFLSRSPNGFRNRSFKPVHFGMITTHTIENDLEKN